MPKNRSIVPAKSAKQKRNTDIEIRITNIREEMRQHYEQIMIDADKALEVLRNERNELKEANNKQNKELIARNKDIFNLLEYNRNLRLRNWWDRLIRKLEFPLPQPTVVPDEKLITDSGPTF